MSRLLDKLATDYASDLNVPSKEELEKAYKDGYHRRSEDIKKFQDWLFGPECSGRLSDIRDEFEKLIGYEEKEKEN